MDYKVLFKKENSEVNERYELVVSGIKSNILNNDTTGKNKVIVNYFRYVAKLVDRINEVYNVPGTSGDPNWTLRLEDDFAKLYSDKLKSEEALNLPLVMIYAMKARGWEFYKNHQELLDKLEQLVNEN